MLDWDNDGKVEPHEVLGSSYASSVVGNALDSDGEYSDDYSEGYADLSCTQAVVGSCLLLIAIFIGIPLVLMALIQLVILFFRLLSL